MTKIVIFNCPPRAGKDYTTDFLMTQPNELNVKFKKASFKEQLFEVALSALPDSPEHFLDLYDLKKEEPTEVLNGLSPRQYMIKVAEEWLKPTFGDDYFGQRLSESIRQAEEDDQDIFLVPDGGFNEEVEPLIREFGLENILILQWSRSGSSFKNDSRDYLTAYPDNTIKLEDNNGSIKDHSRRVFETICQEQIDEWELENINMFQGA
jgi:hypothetical protein